MKLDSELQNLSRPATSSSKPKPVERPADPAPAPTPGLDAVQPTTDWSSVPKWQDLEASPDYAKLTPDERVQAKQAYFEHYIAPRVGAEAAQLRKEFLDIPAAGTGRVDRVVNAVGSAGKAVKNFFDQQGSVMDSFVQPRDAAPAGGPPVTEDARRAVEVAWDSGTPEKRAGLEARQDWVGQLARARAQQYAAFDANATPTTRNLDTRVEGRRQALIGKGEDPRFAGVAAQQGAQRGVTPGREIADLQRTTGTVGVSDFDFDTARAFTETPGLNNPLSRGGAKGGIATLKTLVGVAEAAWDALGADQPVKNARRIGDVLRSKEAAIGERGTFLERNLEGAISSIAQQLSPWLIGAATGSIGVPLAIMTVQSFGQEYSDGKAAGQTPAQAMARASAMAAFEAFGERFGLGETIQAIKGAAKGLPADQIIGFLGRALAKEVPGELLTTTGQMGVDKFGPAGIGLRPNMTTEDYLKAVADTIAQTIMQAGLMAGGTTGVATGVRFLNERGYGERIAEADANDARMRAVKTWENLFQPTNQTPKEPTSEGQRQETNPAEEVLSLGGTPSPTAPTPAPVQPTGGGLNQQSEMRRVELATRQMDGQLTPEERAELDALNQQESQQDNVTQAPEAQQAEAQGQEAPAADIAAPPAEPPKPKGPVLQNRDRSTAQSIAQMTSIAANPDYSRAGFSRDLANGAPVVAGGSIPEDQMGRSDKVTAANGQRFDVRYAVVEADSVISSNDINGAVDPRYGDPETPGTRAIAGNGRVTGLREAFRRGTAGAYVNDLANDDLHGVSPDVIGRMRNPILVRVMPEDQITDDIGDVSNTTGNLVLSPTEQARNDVNRINLDDIEFSEDGFVSPNSLRAFVQTMPQAEQGGLIDSQTGSPNATARDRLNAAIFFKAYQDDALVNMYAEAMDPEARLVINALAQVAPQMSRLEGLDALDIRPLVAEAAKVIIAGKRKGMTMSKIAAQIDLDADPDIRFFVDLFAANPRSNKEAVEKLRSAADFAYREGNKPAFDMLGEVPRASRTDVLNIIKGGTGEQGSTQDLENQGGRGSAENNDQRNQANRNQPQDSAQTPADGKGEDGFDLKQETAAETKARLEREEKEAEERARKEIADRERDVFDLSAPPAGEQDSTRNQTDMFGAGDLANNNRPKPPAPEMNTGLFAQPPAPPPAPVDDFDSMFDRVLSEEIEARKPKTETQAKQQRTAGEALKSAAKNAAKGTGSGLDGLAKLFGSDKKGRLGSGLIFDEETYAQAKPLFQRAIRELKEAANDVEEAMRIIVRDLLNLIGAENTRNMRPYVVRFIKDYRAGKINTESDDATSTGNTAESTGQDGQDQEPVDENAVLDDAEADGQADGPASQGADQAGDRSAGGVGVSGTTASTRGESGDQSIYNEDGTFRVEIDSPGDTQQGGTTEDRRDGNVPDTGAKQGTVAVASLEERLRQQKAAEGAEVKIADAENIKQTLPLLMPSQHEDVLFAERRLSKEDGYGVLFTNGTGTGKTYLGLGIIKRMIKTGKTNGLIVVPNDAVMTEWVRSAQSLNININPLEGIDDKGRGVSITTYANLANNLHLADRDHDFVVADEAHNLMSNAAAETTGALRTLRAITMHTESASDRAKMIERDVVAEMADISSRIDAASRGMRSDDVMDQVYDSLRKEVAELSKRHSVLSDKLAAQIEKQIQLVAERQGAKRTRAVFLSATPFAYERNVQWANEYLFDFGKDDGRNRRYNDPNPYQRFMIQHFGYRMRYNKLAEPDARVDRALMQRAFNSWMRKQGSLSTRMLKVDKDYDRKFVLVDGGIGTRIDQALKWLRETDGGKYAQFYSIANDKFDYLSRARLLESIKAKAAVEYIREQHALGRKVVVFYDYNEGGGFNAFNFTGGRDSKIKVKVRRDGALVDVEYTFGSFLDEFTREFPDLAGAGFENMESPLETLTKAFPSAGVYNGVVAKGGRQKTIDDFNNDSKPEANLLIVQSSANAGWSGHDTSGKFQRVIVNLGLPVAPTKAIQQEGRIYRIGQASNAIFRYFNTGTLWERVAFATKVARRASTAENLAMGEEARALLESFVDAFIDSGNYRPSKDEGIGGKALDQAGVQQLTDFDRAKSFYFGQQKKTSRTKAQEGADYFATPEPVGLKMVQWLNAEPGERLLEPSAGHGAIARWLPEFADRTVIEPSLELASRLGLATDAKQFNTPFEDLNIVNKYDGIVMNPPFGTGGKLAVEHLAKAFRHLSPGGRIVAILPVGPATETRFNDWINGTDEKGRSTVADARFVADVKMPTSTFERAGTTVSTRIVVIDKAPATRGPAPTERDQTPPRMIDLSMYDNINDLFDAINTIEIGRTRQEAAAPGQTTEGQDSGQVVENQEDATFELRGDKILTNAPKVIYTKQNGTDLEGVYVPDAKMAAAVDRFTFKKRGWPGNFVRMKHVIRPAQPSEPGSIAEPQVSYQADPYDINPVRPRTNDAQKELGRAALADIYARIGINRMSRATTGKVTVLGSRIYAGFVASGANRLVGQRVRSAEDLATIAQVYRDPRFETLRVFYIKGDQVVGEAGYTSRLPAMVSMPDGAEGMIKKDMERFGADGYYVLHNHPSGRATPSDADIRLTRWLNKQVNGLRGHVVIDFNEYAAINPTGEFKVTKAPELNAVDFGSNPEIPNPLLGKIITGVLDVATIGKQLQTRGNYGTVITTDSAGRVQLIVDIPMSMLNDTSRKNMAKSKALVRRMARETGSGGNRFLVVPESEQPLTQYSAWYQESVFRDVVTWNRGGWPESLAAATIRPQKDDFVDPKTKRAKTFTVMQEGMQYAPGRNVTPLGFYSALADAVANSKTGSAPAAGWKEAIRGMVNKGVVKQDEVDWTGINDWLDLQQGKVTREAVQAYLEQGGVQVDEVVLGAKVPEKYKKEYDRITSLRDRGGQISHDQWRRQIADLNAQYGFANDASPSFALETKYGRYQLPGGQNYREVLLTLPRREVTTGNVARRLFGKPMASLSEAERDAVAEEMRRIFDAQAKDYRSAHWDQVNVIAHIRMNDRVDADGNRVLFIEEIQSDWGQAGKKKGFKRPESADFKVEVRLVGSWHPQFPETKDKWRVTVNGQDRGYIQADDENEARYKASANETNRRDNSSEVPAAPFVTKTEGWLNLALKRIMVMAAEGGYDKVAFINGEQSADRYDLSKQVDKVAVGTVPSDMGKWQVVARKDGEVVLDRVVANDEDLASLIGKDLAEKAIAKNGGSFTGLDLKVGGEGMRTFYDQIVPAAAKKLLPKVGGGRMGDVEVDFGLKNSNTEVRWLESADGTQTIEWGGETREFATESEARAFRDSLINGKSAQPGFDITPAMREKVSGGMALFEPAPEYTPGLPPQIDVDGVKRPTLNSEGRPIHPSTDGIRNFWRWFGDSKAVDANGQPLVVYHFTTADFTEFSTGDAGAIWLSADPQYTRPAQIGVEGGRTMPVYLRLKNPARLSFQNIQLLTRDDAFRLKQKGYDGAVLDDDFDSPFTEVVAFDSTQIKSATGNIGTFDPNDSSIVREPGPAYSPMSQPPLPLPPGTVRSQWDVPEYGRMDDLIYRFQNRQVNLKNVQDAIRKVASIPEQFDAYLREELYVSRAAARANKFIEKELQPLLIDMKLKGISMEELETYLWARHAKERNAQIAKINMQMPDGGSGLTNAQVDEYFAGNDVMDDDGTLLIKGFNSNNKLRLESLANRVDLITAGTKQTLIQYGLETAETIATWDGTYQNYVPLHREDMNSVTPIGRGYSVKGPASKRALGSSRRVVDILANVALQREAAITRGEKTRVGIALYGLAMQNPSPDFWQVDKIPMIRKLDPQTGVVVSVPDPNYKNADNVLMVRVGGKDRAIVFNRSNDTAMRMVRVLKNLDVQYLDEYIAIAGSITRYFAAINTQYNPIFGFVNGMRDIQAAALNLSTTPLRGREMELMRTVPQAIAAIWKIERTGTSGTQFDTYYEAMRMAGGTTGYRDMFRVGADRSIAIQKEFSRMNARLPRRTFNATLQLLDDYNTAIENATRLAAFKLAIDSGLSQDQAASISKNITVNFNRKGAAGTDINAFYAFFNAAVQGTARMIKTLKGPAGRKIMMAGVTIGALQTIIGMAAFGDDWEDIPEFLKQRNLVIPTGGKNYILIPMPLGFNIFPNIGRIVTEYAATGGKNGSEKIKNLLMAVLDTMNPLGSSTVAQMLSPTIFDPVFALAENKDFTGRPIYKESISPVDQKPGFAMARDNSSFVSRKIAEGLNTASGGTKYTAGEINITPDQIDYIFGVLTGGLGREVNKTYQSIESLVTGKDIPEYRKPLAGRFFGTTDEDATVSSRFWRNLRDMNRYELEIKGRAKDGEDATEIFKKHPEAELFKAADAIERTVSQMRRQRHNIEFNPQIDETERTRLLREKDEQIVGLMRDFNQRVADAKAGR